MKIALLLATLLTPPTWATPPCPNRSVTVVANKEKVEAIRKTFLAMSHLPYEVVTVSIGKEEATLRITYRRLTPGDKFSEPTAMELGDRVYKTLRPKLKEYGIKKIQATYSPDIKC